jgi:hypothetical protein
MIEKGFRSDSKQQDDTLYKELDGLIAARDIKGFENRWATLDRDTQHEMYRRKNWMYTQELRDCFSPVMREVTAALEGMTDEEIFEQAGPARASFTYTNSEKRAALGRYCELLLYDHEVIKEAASIYREPGMFQDIYNRSRSEESFKKEPAKHVALMFFDSTSEQKKAEWYQTGSPLQYMAEDIVAISLELGSSDFILEDPKTGSENVLFFESMQDASLAELPEYEEMRKKYPLRRSERVLTEPFLVRGLKNPMVPRYSYAPIGEYGEQHARLLLQTARVCGEIMYQQFKEKFKTFDDEHEQLLKAVTFYGQESQYSLFKNISSPAGLFSALEGIISIKDAFLLGTMLKLPDNVEAVDAMETLRSERFPTRLSLAAPSLVVGPMSLQGLYISPMLVQMDTGLKMSAPLRSFLVDQKKNQKDRILTPVSGIDIHTGEPVKRHIVKPNERGFGCPVAHKTADEQSPSLDLLVDQFARVYQVLATQHTVV